MDDVDFIRTLEKDHSPDGFPAVKMSILSRMASQIIEDRAIIAKLDKLLTESNRLRLLATAQKDTAYFMCGIEEPKS